MCAHDNSYVYSRVCVKVPCLDDNLKKKKYNGSWVNLKGDGQLATKAGNGEQMCGMVPGLGSVSGCPRPTPWRRRRAELTDVLASWRKEPSKEHRVASCSGFVGGRRAL